MLPMVNCLYVTIGKLSLLYYWSTISIISLIKLTLYFFVDLLFFYAAAGSGNFTWKTFLYDTRHTGQNIGQPFSLYLFSVCGETAISLQSHHVSLVQWTTRLLPVMRDPGSNPQGGT